MLCRPVICARLRWSAQQSRAIGPNPRPTPLRAELHLSLLPRLNGALHEPCRRFLSTSPRTCNDQNGQRYPVRFVVFLTSCLVGFGLWNSRPASKVLNDAPPPLHVRVLEQPVEGEGSVIWKGMVYPALDLTAANMKLRAEEMSTNFPTARETSVTRYDSIRLASNDPCEDERSYGVGNVGEPEDWKFWGVYDGHAGWATARVLRGYLTAYVAQAIRRAKTADPTLSPQTIDNAIKTGFLNLDHEIISDGLKALSDAVTHAEAVSRIAPARAGSCAILAAFDPISARLHVAVTGDSRAVLGRCSLSGQMQASPGKIEYTAEALSIDQTGFNEKELDRINNAHPNEPDAIDKKTGRLLGLAVTRAFGDHRWKWPLDAINKCNEDYYGTPARPKYESPPYLTAEPEVTTTTISKGDFLILASDGLWDHVSTKDAVECVSMWINHQRQQASDSTENSSSKGLLPAALTSTSLTSPPSASGNDGHTHGEQPSKFNYDYRGTPEHFVVEDTNVATHLVRNALGGSRRELFCSVMTMRAPDSRDARDDVTVQVVFFGDVLGSRG